MTEKEKAIERNDLDWIRFHSKHWGWWSVLEVGKGYKVKKIVVYPGQHLSNQYHIHREESWTIVQGEGKVILDEEERNLKVGDTFYVKKECVHQIFNTSTDKELFAIEVQIGDTTSEYDIIRL